MKLAIIALLIAAAIAVAVPTPAPSYVPYGDRFPKVGRSEAADPVARDTKDIHVHSGLDKEIIRDKRCGETAAWIKHPHIC